MYKLFCRCPVVKVGNFVIVQTDIIENRGMSLADLISICMYVSDMDDYAQFNSGNTIRSIIFVHTNKDLPWSTHIPEYNEFFESQPPVRGI